MNKIKWKNIGIGATILVVIAVLVYVKYFVTPSVETTQVASTTSGSNTTTSVPPTGTLQEVNTVDNSSTVGIQSPPAPNGGKIRSISMLGPSGVYNSIVQTDGKNYKLLKKAFTPLLVNEGAVSTDDIKKVLNQYVADSWNSKPGVSSNGDIQIVIASSVATNAKVQAALPELKKTYVVTSTSSEMEGGGAFKVAVAPQYQNTAFVMDITPTIVRFTYQNGGSTKTIVAKAGSKYYQNNQTKEQALAEISQAVMQIPASNRSLCIVLWAAAEKDLRQGANRYSTVPNYTGSERSTTSGLELINEVKRVTNANMVIDYESMWFMEF